MKKISKVLAGLGIYDVVADDSQRCCRYLLTLMEGIPYRESRYPL